MFFLYFTRGVNKFAMTKLTYRNKFRFQLFSGKQLHVFSGQWNAQIMRCHPDGPAWSTDRFFVEYDGHDDFAKNVILRKSEDNAVASSLNLPPKDSYIRFYQEKK